MRLTKKITGEWGPKYVWSDEALAVDDPTVIGRGVREIVGVCEDYGLTAERIREIMDERKQNDLK